MKRYIFIILKVLLICILAFSVFRLASLGAGLVRDRENFEAMKTEMKQATDKDTGTENRAEDPYEKELAEYPAQPDTGDTEYYIPVTEKEPDSNEGYHMPIPANRDRFDALIKRNPDFAGWIRIEGTVIDYPVMFPPKEADFYLHHDFDKNDSKSGVPYIGKNCGQDCDNTIIYAHNMKNGTMFAGLLKYKDESFYKDHPVISFDTVEENGIYDIIAVFREKVHYRDEMDVFRYYDYCGELDENKYNDYINNIKSLSLYETGKTAVHGQKLLTLSTCSYHTENGRFVVVAVKR